jgi:hypothetical protein
MKCPEPIAPACSGSNLNFELTSSRRAGALRGRVPVLHPVKLQSGSLLFRSGELSPNLKGPASGTSREFAQFLSKLATAARADQNRDVILLLGPRTNCKASGWSHGLVSPNLRANPSLNVTRYGRLRLAAPAACGIFASAAKRRLPPRSR